ncbi:hypothetical protein RND81_09G204700 [Saponaria officinalis]|uniref:Uncharacterized protein n=1 Tax=Saponaria officinalis TaxID=3572 RepID=A0AAW1IQD9_SAPOF
MSSKRTIDTITHNSSSAASSSILGRVTSAISDSTIVQKGKGTTSDAMYVGKKLFKSTGKATWIAATTAIVLFLPLFIELDRDTQLDQMDLQASLLGSPAPPPKAF